MRDRFFIDPVQTIAEDLAEIATAKMVVDRIKILRVIDSMLAGV